MIVFLNVNRHFANAITNDKFRDHKFIMIQKLEQYLGTTSCRRRYCTNIQPFPKDIITMDFGVVTGVILIGVKYQVT